MKSVLKFFDLLEDSVRGTLAHYPIIYSFIGGIAIVLFWRGVWMLADDYQLTAEVSLLASVLILLATGLFVSFFIGDSIILAGLRREKKVIDQTEDEVDAELDRLRRIESKINTIEKLLSEKKSV